MPVAPKESASTSAASGSEAGAQSGTEVFESLLHLMRSPAEVIERVDETCEIRPGEAGRRRIRLIIRPHETHSHAFQYVDLKHPRKGTFDDIQFTDPVHVTRLSHTEHMIFSASMIQFRLELPLPHQVKVLRLFRQTFGSRYTPTS